MITPTEIRATPFIRTLRIRRDLKFVRYGITQARYNENASELDEITRAKVGKQAYFQSTNESGHALTAAVPYARGGVMTESKGIRGEG